MGGSSKKTTTDQTTTSQNTLPSWATSSLQNLNGSIDALGNADPQSYVAPASTLQNQAYSNAANLGSNQALYGQAAQTAQAGTGTNLNSGGVTSNAATANAAGNITGATANAAGNITGATANAASLLDGSGINGYMSPYVNDVVNSALNTYDTSAAQQTAALKAQAAGSGAFGDSTYGIASGLLGSQLAAGRTSTASNLLNTAYNNAAALDQTDTANRQAANLANAGYSQQANLANQSNQQAANMANAGYSQQAALANQSNQQAANMANAGYQQQTDQSNAAAQQAAMLANQSSQNDASARQLTAAGLLGNLGTAEGNDARSNAETQDALGQDQRSIAQAQATAPISLAQTLASLYGQNQFGLLGGSTSNTQGTTTSSTDPGLLGTLGQVASTGASLASLFTPAAPAGLSSFLSGAAASNPSLF